MINTLMTFEDIKVARDEIWNEYMNNLRKDESVIKELEECSMDYGEVTMKYGMQIIGEPDEHGYPLYIALHGGGQSDTKDINDSQWKHMYVYYRDSVKSGIYINPRGVRDTWDTHGNPESYPLYDRLIRNMIAFKGADPNRVYILGFSAGGDGVYMVAPRMADRFAACNMSAGHHNGTSVVNLYNTPIALQVGMNDIYYNRHLVTPEYGIKLDKMRDEMKGGYIHTTFVHKDKGHNFFDNKDEEQLVLSDIRAFLEAADTTSHYSDTNAVRFVNQFTRNPLPTRVVWDLGNRGIKREVSSFYWLSASYDVCEGCIIASIDKEKNRIVIEKEEVDGCFSILVNEEMLDVFSAVEIVGPSGDSVQLNLKLSIEALRETTYERGDKNYQFIARINYKELGL